MPVLLRYRKTDGMIVGGWEGNTLALLYAQVPADDAEHNYHTDLSGQALDMLVQGFYVEGLQLVPKRQLVITAERNPFTSHARYCWHVRVMPFEPCTILVDGIPYSLTEEDKTLEIDSDELHTFTITLVPMAQARAEPLMLEGV